RWVPAEQLLDDVVLIAARAESAAASRDHDRAYVGLAVEPFERLGELLVDLERERVEPLRAVERDRRDPARWLVREGRRRRRAHPLPSWGTAWFSTRAWGSTSPVPATRALAGKKLPSRSRHTGPSAFCAARYAAMSMT